MWRLTCSGATAVDATWPASPFAAAALRSLARASLVEPARPPALPDPPVEEKRVRAGGPAPRRGQRRWAVVGAVAGLALLTGGVGAAIGAALATSTRPGAPPAAGPAVVLQPVAATTVSGSARMSGAGDGQVMTIEVRGLPASLARHFSTIDVSIEPNDGDPTHSARSLLRVVLSCLTMSS